MRSVLLFAAALAWPAVACGQTDYAQLLSVSATPERIELTFDRDVLAEPWSMTAPPGFFYVHYNWEPSINRSPTHAVYPSEDYGAGGDFEYDYGLYTQFLPYWCGYVDGWIGPQCLDESRGSTNILAYDEQTFTVSLHPAPVGSTWEYTGVDPPLHGVIGVPEPSAVVLLLVLLSATGAYAAYKRSAIRKS